MPSDIFGLSGAWRDDGKHWHAYCEHNADPSERSVDRMHRIRRDPDAVLRSPDEVAEWIERRILELGARTSVMAPADKAWVEIGDADDLAHLFGEHVVIASHGDSIYTDVFHPRARIELYIEAVTADVCDLH